jgi:hypothetical protein
MTFFQNSKFISVNRLPIVPCIQNPKFAQHNEEEIHLNYYIFYLQKILNYKINRTVSILKFSAEEKFIIQNPFIRVQIQDY